MNSESGVYPSRLLIMYLFAKWSEVDLLIGIQASCLLRELRQVDRQIEQIEAARPIENCWLLSSGYVVSPPPPFFLWKLVGALVQFLVSVVVFNVEPLILHSGDSVLTHKLLWSFTCGDSVFLRIYRTPLLLQLQSGGLAMVVVPFGASFLFLRTHALRGC